MPVKICKQLATESNYHGAVMVRRKSGDPQLGPAIMMPREASLPDSIHYTSDRFCFFQSGYTNLALFLVFTNLQDLETYHL